MYHAIVLVHAAIGTIALLSFWAAAFARKGGSAHRAIGRTFMIAMCGIGATALPMALVQFARGNPVTGTFLSYLLVITATACARAWFAVRWKREPARYFGRWYRALALGNLAAGATVLAVGLSQHTPLFIGFSSVGFGLGAQMWWTARRSVQPRWMIAEHYRGMLGNGVATHVAFLSIGLGRLLPDYANVTQMLAWFGPLLVSLVAGAYLRRRYGSVRTVQTAAAAATTAA